MFPLSLTRTLKAFSFIFMIGIFLIFYVAFAIFIEFFKINSYTPGMSYVETYKHANKFNFDSFTVTFPLAIFSFCN